MKICKYQLLFIILVFLSFGFTFAQSQPDTLKYNSGLTLGGMRKGGVFTQTSINLGLTTTLEKAKWDFYNNIKYSYINANDFQLADDWTVVSRFQLKLSNQQQISPTLIHVYKNNLLYLIQNSQRYLLGLSIQPLKKKKGFWFFVGGGYETTLYERAVFENSPLIGTNRNFGLGTFYIENEHHLIQNKLFLKYGIFYIQSLEEWSDYTIWIIPSLNVQLNKNFILALSYDYRFRNVHLVDIPNFNDVFNFNIKVSIGN